MDLDIGTKLERLNQLRTQAREKARIERLADIDLILRRMDVFDQSVASPGLTAWQLEVAEARLAIIKEVEAVQTGTMSFSVAAKHFERKAQDGELPEKLTKLILKANTRPQHLGRPEIGMGALIRWCAAYDGNLESLAPAVGWNNAIPGWVKIMFELWKEMDQPTIKGVVAELRRRGFTAEHHRAKRYIKQLADQIRGGS